MGKFLRAAVDDLVLYVRQTAWLSVVPDRRQGDQSTAAQKSRLQSLRDAAKDEDYSPPMPEAGTAEYLLDHLWSVGPTTGEFAVTQSELRHYQDNSGLTLSPWECSTLHRISQAYVQESHQAREPGCKAPWQSEEVNIDRYLAAKQAQEAMRQLANI